MIVSSRPPSAIRRSLVCLVLILASALSQTDLRSAAARFTSLFAPSVTATLTDSFPAGGDVDGDGKADPGDTIRYTATMAVSGETATGVAFNTTIDGNTTLVAGSLVVSPLARSDSYQSVGNMTLTSADIGADCANPLRSLLCNDLAIGATISGFGPTQGFANDTPVDGINTVLTTSSGTVLLNTNGTFVYDPAAGFEGTDQFWYTLTNTAGTHTAHVSITVGGANGMAWFVTSGGTGTGRQADPFSLEFLRTNNNGAGSNPNDNDTIFLFEGTHTLTAFLPLRTNQKLFGQDVNGVTLAELGAPAAQPGNAWPALDAGGGTVSITSIGFAIALGSNNEIAGFTVGAATTAIGGGAVGALNVRDVVVATNGTGLAIALGGTMTTTAPYTGFTSITTTGGNGASQRGVSLFNLTGTLALGGGSISGVSDESFLVSDGNADITYAGTITHTSSFAMISIANTTGGSVTFTTAVPNGLNHVSGGGTGVSIHGAAGSVTVNNADLNTGTGIQVTGDALHVATGTYTFNNVTVDPPAGSGLVVQGQAPQYFVSAVIDLNNVDITNPVGQVASIQGMSGGSIDFDAASAIIRNNGGPGILAANNSGGTFTFNSATLQLTTSTNYAVSLVSNFGSAMFNFTGALDIDTTSGIGFNAIGGGIISVSGGARTINTVSGQAVVMNGVVIGPSGVGFDAIGVSAGPVGTDALSFNAVSGGTFSGGVVTVNGIPPTGDGIEINASSSAFTFASVTIDNTGGAGIRLTGANGIVTFTTVDIDGTTGAGIDISGNTSAVNINGGTIGATDDPAGNVVDISVGTANVTVAAALTKSSAGAIVEITDRLGFATMTIAGSLSCSLTCYGISVRDNTLGTTINFSGASKVLNTAVASGVFLLNNTGAAINFTGGNLVIDSTDGNGFQAIGGGTVTVHGVANTINAPQGTALEISNTNIGAGHLTFQSVSAGNAVGTGATGIILSNTGSAGGLHITGTGTAASGGTIQHKVGSDSATTSGIGIYLNNTSDVQLDWMQLNDFENFAIRGNNVTGFTLANSIINSATTNGTLQVPDTGEGSVRFDNLMGTASITNSTITHGIWDNVAIVNNNPAAALTFTATNSTFAATTLSGTGNDAVRIEVEDPIAGAPQAEASITITGCIFTAARGDLLDITAQRNAVAGTVANAAIVRADIIGSNFTNNHPTVMPGSGGVVLRGNGNATYNLDDNDLQGASGNAVWFTKGDSAGIINAVANNNRIGVSGVPLSGSSSSNGIMVSGHGQGSMTASLTNNTILRTAQMGIKTVAHSSTPGGGGTLNLTATGNVVDESFGGFMAQLGNGPSPDFSSACIDIGGATAVPPGNDFHLADPGDVNEILLMLEGDSTLRLPGYGGTDNDETAITSYLRGRNANGASTAVAFLNTATITTDAGACTQPLLSSLGQPGFMLAPHALPASDALRAAIAAPARWIAARLDDVRAAVRLAHTAPRAVSTVRPVALVATPARGAGSWRAPSLSLSALSWARAHLASAMRTALLVAQRVPDLLTATLEARSGETVFQNIGTIPAGQSVTITFDVTVNAPPRAQYSTQGVATGSNFTTVITDDTALGGSADPTITPGDRYDTTTVLEASPASAAFFNEAVTLTATVTADAGGGTPSGTVTFKESGANINGCINAPLDGSGAATCDIAGGTFSAGLKSFTAEYGGDTSHDPSVNTPALSYTYDACTIDPVVSNGIDGDIGPGTLRHSFADACPGSTITFDTEDITSPITLTSGELLTTRDVTVQWPGAGTLEFRREGTTGDFRIFHVPAGRTVTLDKLTITNGSLTAFGLSGRGGGILNEGTLTIRNSIVSGNTVAGQGAGIANSASAPETTASLTIQDTTISGNTTTYLGGGIVNEAVASSTALVTIKNSLIAGNFANDGGGIYNNGSEGTVTLAATNVTISGNAAGGGAGALMNVLGPVTITNGTIINNQANIFGFPFPVVGGIDNLFGTLTLHNTIVAGNARDGVPSNISGPVAGSSAANLIGDGSGMTGITHGANGNLVGTAGSPINPMLTALANHGGPTLTHALQSGSPAIDAGRSVIDPITSLPLVTDQRGRTRPVDNPHVVNAVGGDGSDIGAFEAPAPPATPDLQTASDLGTSGTDNVTNDNTPTFDIGGVVAGAFVELLVDGSAVASDTAAGTTVTLTVPAISEGPHAITARQTAAGDASDASPALAITIDTTAPPAATLDLDDASDSGINNADNITNAATRVFNIGGTVADTDVSLLRDGSGISSTTGTGGPVQLSDATTFTSGQIYAYTVRQADTAGNFADSAAVNVTIDDTRPSVLLSSGANEPTAASPIAVNVTFDEHVYSLEAGDIAAGNATVGNFSGSGFNYSFELTPTADGAVTADIGADAATDVAGNTNTAASQFSRTYDATGPTAAITAVSPDPRNGAVTAIDIVFDEAVVGFILSDLSLRLDAGSNLLPGSATLSSSDNVTWTLGNLSGLTGAAGTYALALTAAGLGISDVAGNTLRADATDTWVMETTAPTVTINQAAGQIDPAPNASTINFTTVFSEPINPATFTDADIDLSGGTATATTVTITEIAPNDGTTFTVAFSGSSPGDLVATIPGDAVEDLAGNLSDASTSTDNTVTLLLCTGSTLTVTSTDDAGPGTLRQALADVCPAGTITFDVSGPGPHTVTLTTGAFLVDRDVTILGPASERVVLDGGGITNLMLVPSGTTVRIDRLTFANGNSAGEGGAIFNVGTLSIYDSTFTGNSALTSGGAIANEGVLGLANSTISGNSSVGAGGGIFNGSGGLLLLINTTITNNETGDAGGGLYNFTDVYMENTILSGNTALNSHDNLFDDAGGVTNDLGHNLVDVDAMLGPLQDNGGPTLTHAPLAGSPAIDAGNSVIPPAAGLIYDQRGAGFGRIRDGADANTDAAADIGAIEADPSIEDISDKTTEEGTPFSFTFNVGDPASTPQPIVVSSSNTTLLPAGNLVLSQASPSSWTLTVTPVAGQFGTSTVTLSVGMSDSFVVTVTPVAGTPTISSTSTIEDTPTTSGLVIGSNVSDGAEVTHFKVVTLIGGTLFQHDGVTPIAPGAFITAAQSGAGLVLLPAPNTFGLATLGVRASISASDAGLGGGEAILNIVVQPVADTPSITNALTTVNHQTTGGLVITRNPVDGNEVTHYKVAAITGGTLFQTNGTTPIAAGDFITIAQGAAGLRFTPTTGSTATGQVTVQASTSNTNGGLGGNTVTADIVVVGTFTDNPLIAGVTPIKLIHLLELRARVNAQRVRFGLAEAVFTGKAAGVSLITAQDLLEIRTALSQAYVAHGLTAPTFTDPGLAAATVIKAVHFQELRAAILALEAS